MDLIELQDFLDEIIKTDDTLEKLRNDPPKRLLIQKCQKIIELLDQKFIEA